MASANYWQRGETLDYTNSGASKIDAGTIILLGTKLAVAACDIPAGGFGSVHVEGVFGMPKATGAITAGAAVYWDATNSVITTTSTNNTLAGYAVYAAASDSDTCFVKINA